MKILVIHGPNLNLLGEREPDIYGRITLKEINESLQRIAKNKKVELEIKQLNSEGEIVETIQRARSSVSSLLINPAGYTHTSVAIRDAIVATGIPTVEVHLTNIHSREDFRRISLIAPVVAGQISGFGAFSYELGLLAAIEIAKSTHSFTTKKGKKIDASRSR